MMTACNVPPFSGYLFSRVRTTQKHKALKRFLTRAALALEISAVGVARGIVVAAIHWKIHFPSSLFIPSIERKFSVSKATILYKSEIRLISGTLFKELPFSKLVKV